MNQVPANPDSEQWTAIDRRFRNWVKRAPKRDLLRLKAKAEKSDTSPSKPTKSSRPTTRAGRSRGTKAGTKTNALTTTQSKAPPAET